MEVIYGFSKDFIKLEIRKAVRTAIENENNEEIDENLASELINLIERNIAYKHHQNLLAERAAKQFKLDKNRIDVFLVASQKLIRSDKLLLKY